MQMLLDLVLTIVSTLSALCLLLLGILLLLGRLPLRLSRRTWDQLRQLLSGSSAPVRAPVAMTASSAPATPDQTLANQPTQVLGPMGTSLLPATGPSTVLQKTTPLADGIAPPENPATPSAISATDSQTNERLLIQLLRKLEGDVDRRDRLIKYAKYRQPGQSDTWYLEKVIHDLDRDASR
jgi:hypothetical protein